MTLKGRKKIMKNDILKYDVDRIHQIANWTKNFKDHLIAGDITNMKAKANEAEQYWTTEEGLVTIESLKRRIHHTEELLDIYDQIADKLHKTADKLEANQRELLHRQNMLTRGEK